MARKPFDPTKVKASGSKRPGGREGLMTVSQITNLVKRAIDDALPTTVHVVGQISNFKRHSSGHLYFTLKDASSELSCVMWRSAAAKLKFAPTDGLEVVADGKIEVFERAGRYQLYTRKIEPRGVGALELAFRQLRERLDKEDLFDPGIKKQLSPYPTRIVVVTSPTGAALVDILRTIDRRYPCVEVLVFPVRVQGPDACKEIASAIVRTNACDKQLGGVDLMIVGRGGGSLEDLWAFNEEVVARAVHASGIPIISAVGHEIDVSIADLVADVRAATPTAAAELAVPVLTDVLDDLARHESRIARSFRGGIELASLRLDSLVKSAWCRDPMRLVHRREESADEITTRMQRHIERFVHQRRRRVDDLEAVLRRIAPHAYLLRTAVRLRDARYRLYRSMERLLGEADRALAGAMRRVERNSPERFLPLSAGRVASLDATLTSAMRNRFLRAEHDVRLHHGVLSALSYKSVLGRGYTITRTKKKRKVVRTPGTLVDGQRIITETACGQFESEVVNLNQLELFD